MHPSVLPLGEAALIVELGTEIDLETNLRVHALARWLEANPCPGYLENVPGYASVVVHYEPRDATSDDIAKWIRTGLENMSMEATDESPIIEIPTRYGGEFGADLAFVAQLNHLTEHQVVEIHSAHIYRVYMLGFAPGFAYLGQVPNEIAAPRLDTPRTRVPAGSVAIAGRQTGIYPRESPGGWRLIGHTDAKLFDASSESPTLLKPGDRVRFVPL
jgi:KipI family sensor histidine kinase inhibitor